MSDVLDRLSTARAERRWIEREVGSRWLARALRVETLFQPVFRRFGSLWHTAPDFEPLRGREPSQRLLAPSQ